MKTYLRIILSLALLASAHGQTGTAKSRAALNTEINTLFPSNTAGAITAEKLRQGLLDMASSFHTPITDGTAVTTSGSYVDPSWLTLTKTKVGLPNVDNTSDANKPISTATQTALDAKAAASHTHSNATSGAAGFMSASDKSKLDAIEAGATADQTDAEIEAAYNNRVAIASQAEAEAGTGTTVLRWTPQRLHEAILALAPSGGSTLWGGIGGTLSNQTDLQTALNGKVPTTRTVNGHALSADATVTKSDVGLGNADNTSDANKPVSTAQAASIATKQAANANLSAVAALTTDAFGLGLLELTGASGVRTYIGLGTSAVLNVPASGNAASGEVAKGSDTRFSDTRTPTDATVTAAKIAASLKPSGTAATSDEALRALGTAAGTAAAGNDSRLSDTRTPTDGSVTAAKIAASLKPTGTAAASDEALRALGTSSSTAAAGNDSRLSDTRTPTDGTVTLAKIAAALKPSGTAAAGDESLRALGTSSSTAAAGNDARLSDTRTPTDGTVTAAKIAASLKPSGTAVAADEALRALGTSASTAAAGNDARLSDARTPTSHTHPESDVTNLVTDLAAKAPLPTWPTAYSGTTPNPVFTDALQNRTFTITGNTTFGNTSPAYAQGRVINIFITADSSTRTVAFTDTYTWTGGAPTAVTASKNMWIQLVCTGSTAADVFAVYAEVP